MNAIKENECFHLRLFSFPIPRKEYELNVFVSEKLKSDYGMYVWPSAVVLAQYVIHNQDLVKDKNIIELGAGTALPGLVAAKLGAFVTLTESENFSFCFENCKRSMLSNGLDKIEMRTITWGVVDDFVQECEAVDIILASDCFYDSRDFEDIIMTVSFLLDKFLKAEFWTTYHIRSTTRSIDYLLMKWGLVGYEIPLHQFEANKKSIAKSDLPGDCTVKMFVIKKKEL